MQKLMWSLLSMFFALPALATGLQPHEGVGQPVPMGIGLQASASPIKEQMEWFHNDLLMPIITGICILVLLLLIYVMVRFNAKANPVSSKTAHNTLIEVIWTVVPILILIVISVPSLKLLYLTERSPQQTEMTLKVVGHQWYWEYVYPEANGVSFSAYMKKTDELKEGEPRLLETDRRVVLPIDTNIKIIVTATDVLHSWTVPAFGVKRDAVPGRLNETWVRINKEGVYYGQCSELCGTDHSFMPIAIEAVSKEAYAQWIAAQQAEQGLTPVVAPVSAAPALPVAPTTAH